MVTGKHADSKSTTFINDDNGWIIPFGAEVRGNQADSSAYGHKEDESLSRWENAVNQRSHCFRIGDTALAGFETCRDEGA
jgi:hypothetical protein